MFLHFSRHCVCRLVADQRIFGNAFGSTLLVLSLTNKFLNRTKEWHTVRCLFLKNELSLDEILRLQRHFIFFLPYTVDVEYMIIDEEGGIFAWPMQNKV